MYTSRFSHTLLWGMSGISFAAIAEKIQNDPTQLAALVASFTSFGVMLIGLSKEARAWYFKVAPLPIDQNTPIPSADSPTPVEPIAPK